LQFRKFIVNVSGVKGTLGDSAGHHAGDAHRAARMVKDLKAAGLKLTAQRLAIVRQFADDLSHPTAQELYDRLKTTFPTMSFATVYNTLDALALAGLSGTLRLGNAARFDPNTSPHHHAVCERCGAIADIPAGTLAPTPAIVSRLRRRASGFQVRSVERIYRGLCAACGLDVRPAEVRPEEVAARPLVVRKITRRRRRTNNE
jgi:Fe2+ or Zn2+ uptake regulation protein